MSALLSPEMSKTRTLDDGWYTRPRWATAHYLVKGFSLCSLLIRDLVEEAAQEKPQCTRCARSFARNGGRTRWWQ